MGFFATGAGAAPIGLLFAGPMPVAMNSATFETTATATPDATSARHAATSETAAVDSSPTESSASDPSAGAAGGTNALASERRRQLVDYPARETPGTIVIYTTYTHVYFVLGGGQAIRYGVGRWTPFP